MMTSTTKVYDESLQERVREYMKNTGISQNKLAPRVGVSSASLSNYLRNKMEGSVEGIENRLREFLQQDRFRRLRTIWMRRTSPPASAKTYISPSGMHRSTAHW